MLLKFYADLEISIFTHPFAIIDSETRSATFVWLLTQNSLLRFNRKRVDKNSMRLKGIRGIIIVSTAMTLHLVLCRFLVPSSADAFMSVMDDIKGPSIIKLLWNLLLTVILLPFTSFMTLIPIIPDLLRIFIPDRWEGNYMFVDSLIWGCVIYAGYLWQIRRGKEVREGS